MKKLLIIFLALSLGIGAEAATFGKTDVGVNCLVGLPNANNTKSTSQFTLSENGDVTKLTVYFNDVDIFHNGGVLKGIIYDSSGDAANNLKGVTTEYTQVDNNTAEWEDITFASPVNLTAGNYFIGVISSTPKTTCADVAGNNNLNADTYSDGASDPFGEPITSTLQKSIYATYTASTPATTPADVLIGDKNLIIGTKNLIIN